MKRAIRLGILGAAVYGAALAVQIPAGWIAHWAGGRLPAGVTLSGVEGSLWHPKVARIDVDLPGRGVLRAGPAEARLRPLGLLTGRLVADIQARALDGRTSARAAVGWGGQWRVPRASVTMPLARLADIDSRLAFGQQGQITVEAEGLRGRGFPDQGEVRAVIADFTVPGLGPEGPFGTYTADATFSGGGQVQGRVATDKARMLAIEGRFQADLEGRRARFNGEAWAPEGAPPAARQLLSLFGTLRSGRAQIRWQGSLAP